MGGSFDHFTTGRFIWKVIKIHSIQSMCELINDLSRLSWGAAHPKHLPAVHSGDSHGAQVHHCTQKLSCSPESGNFREFYTHAKTFWAKDYLPTASWNQINSREQDQIFLWTTQYSEPYSTSTWKPALAGKGYQYQMMALKCRVSSLDTLKCKWTWEKHTLLLRVTEETATSERALKQPLQLKSSHKEL